MKKFFICQVSLALSMVGTTYAMAPSGGGGGTPGIVGLFPILLMFLVLYFLIIFPQQRKQKQHREMLNELKKGDRIVTSGGLHGMVANIKENIVVLEVDKKVNVNVEKSAISSVKREGMKQGG